MQKRRLLSDGDGGRRYEQKTLPDRWSRAANKSERSMTVVIVGLGAEMTFTQGQTRLTALEGLTLALLIATEQEGTIRRIEIEANHIPELLFKGQILGKFEALESMRSDRVSRPQTLNARFAQAGFPRHRAHAPGSSARSLSSSQAQGRADGRSRYCRLAPPPGSVFKPLQAFAAQRFLQRPMAKRLTPCSRDISSWLSPSAKPKMILALKTSR